MATALERIERANKVLMMHPDTVHYACINAHYPIVINTSIKTACTNGRVRTYNPDFVAGLSDAELLFTICHEADHDSKKHVFRLGNRNLRLANIAADYQVNQDLTRIPFLKMPKKCLLDARFDGMSFEAIYRVLEAEKREKEEEERQKQKQQEQDDDSADNQDNDSSDSSDESDDSDQDTDSGDNATDDDASGNQDDASDDNDSDVPGDQDDDQDDADPGMCGGFTRPDDAGDAAAMADLENEHDVMIAQALQAAARMNAGHLPGAAQSIAIEKRKSQQNWAAELREFFTTSVKTDYSWSRPDRRFGLSDFILPSEISDGINHFGLAVDFSYSIQQEWLDTFLGESQAMLDLGIIDKLTVVLFHTEVFQSFEFNTGDIIEIDTAERGGTKFAPVFEWFRENAPDIAGLCMLTDLEPWESWPELEAAQVDCPTLFAVYGDPIRSREYIKQATFGRCLPLWDN
jgi:predicted metal-dependent peptidase